MRGIRIMACCLALLTGGCNPLAERRFINEGAGVDLYTPDRASQVELLQQYEAFVCEQVGRGCEADWGTFVMAGMNDIDLRCDGFLTWLDARRRDREPILAEISAINTAVHSVMTVTGSTPKSLDIVTAAFGLASASYANWNSRLLISANQSTVQDVVYSSQGDYRAKIRTFPVPDRPTAIYLLRNYLRLCMPTTIEASINTSSTLVQRGVATGAQPNLVVAAVVPGRPSVIRDVNIPMQRLPAVPVQPRPAAFPADIRLSTNDMRFVLNILCRPQSESDLGPAGSAARKDLANFLAENGKARAETLDRNAFLALQDLSDQKKRAC